MLLLFLALAGTPVVVSGGSPIDYMPSPLQNTDGSILVAFERMTPPGQGFIGDILITLSTDTGSTWSTPTIVVEGSANQRHPALVHVPSGGYRIVYLSDQSGGYGVFSAFSADGTTWTEEGQLDLGWTAGSFGNPSVSSEGDTALVISYDKFFGLGGYVSRSTDGGTSWDTEMRRINTRGRLNRILRHPDGTYLCAWQETGGGSVVNIFASYSSDLETWAPSESLTTNDNGHDAMPFVDENQVAWIYYAKYEGSVYRIMRCEVPSWGSYGEEILVYGDSHHATQPHPLLLADGRTALFWGSWWNNYNESDVMVEILDFSGIEESEEAGNPISVSLYPSPFTSTLSVDISLSETAFGSIAVYDLSGRLVESIGSDIPIGGVHLWEPGELLPVGGYIIQVKSGEYTASEKCLYLH